MAKNKDNESQKKTFFRSKETIMEIKANKTEEKTIFPIEKKSLFGHVSEPNDTSRIEQRYLFKKSPSFQLSQQTERVICADVEAKQRATVKDSLTVQQEGLKTEQRNLDIQSPVLSNSRNLLFVAATDEIANTLLNIQGFSRVAEVLQTDSCSHVCSLSLSKNESPAESFFETVIDSFKSIDLQKYFRIILVTSPAIEQRAIMTGIALWLASLDIPVNIFSSKGRSPAQILKKIEFTLSLPPMPKNGVGDGIKVLPSSFPASALTKEVKRLPLQEAEKLLAQTFTTYKPGERVVIAIDPGAGKTTTLSKIHESLGPILFLSPTIKLAQEFVNAVGPKATLFRGRSESLCHKTGEVAALGNARRSIAANLCQKCEHGIVTQISFGSERAEKTKEEMEMAGVDFSQAQSCGYITQIHNLKSSPVLAAAEASLAGSPKHLTDYEGGEDSGKRLVVWDDCFTPYAEIVVKTEDLELWIERAKAERDVAQLSEHKDWLSRSIVILECFLDLCREKEQKNQPPVTVSRTRPPASFGNWRSVSSFLENYPIKLKHMDGTVLEAIKNTNSEKVVPLRGIMDLAKALSLGTVWIKNKAVVFTIPTLSLDTFIQSGGIVLDATPHPFLREIADKIVEIRIEQPGLQVNLDASSWRGRTGLGTTEGVNAAAKNLLEYVPGQEEAKPVSIITHKPIASAIRESAAFSGRNLLLGHWGAHNRGHNDYMKTNVLILDGVPVPPPDAFFTSYETCRNLLTYCNSLKVWQSLDKVNPEESETRVRKAIQLPLISGIAGIKAFVPDNSDAERFLREVVTAEVVQAVGRLRAVRRPGEQLEVLIRTAFPLSSAYGLELHKVWGHKDAFEIVERCKRKLLAIYSQ
jgi:hypothetical protein